MQDYIPPELRATQTERRAQIERVSNWGAMGSLIVFDLIALYVLLAVSWLVGLLMLAMSSIAGIFLRGGWRCQACGNRVADDKVRLCPTCGVKLIKPLNMRRPAPAWAVALVVMVIVGLVGAVVWMFVTA